MNNTVCLCARIMFIGCNPKEINSSKAYPTEEIKFKNLLTEFESVSINTLKVFFLSRAKF